jgi:microcystin-dependent protein
MGQPYVGEVRMGGWNFAPAGWMLCQGQLVPISEFETLFNLIGTTFGGDGQSTFGLPDLQGRVPLHQGSNGVTNYTLGELGGVETVTLTVNQMPIHNHPVIASGDAGDSNDTGNAFLGSGQMVFSPTPHIALNTLTDASVGGSQPHDNLQPFLVINFVISLFGVFPSQT